MAVRSGVHTTSRILKHLKICQAKKFILSYYSSDYKSMLLSLHLLPLDKLNDITFLSNHCQTHSTFSRMLHSVQILLELQNTSNRSTPSVISTSDDYQGFRMPSPINLSQSSQTLKNNLKELFWLHFRNHNDPNNTCNIGETQSTEKAARPRKVMRTCSCSIIGTHRQRRATSGACFTA